MTFIIDHITLAAESLDMLTEKFSAVGLRADYGGPHENGVTHMAQLGFSDGSYLEFITPLTAGKRSPIWDDFMAGSAGPCAWCVESQDVATEAIRLKSRAIPVRGPVLRGRRRPDGVKLEWQLAFVGEGSPGALYPFIIQDMTPKSLRVSESADARKAGVVGIEAVVLCVDALDTVVADFRAAYDLPEAVKASLPGLDADVVLFPGEPLMLACPRQSSHQLTERLRRFGPAPCGAIFAVQSLQQGLGYLWPERLPPEDANAIVHLTGLMPGPATYFAIAERGIISRLALARPAPIA